jgi:deoxyribonuclease IV
MSRFGLHIDPPLAQIPAVLKVYGRRVFQTTLRDTTRLSKTGIPDDADQDTFRQGASEIADLWGIAHASMLTNLASPDNRIRHGSAGALVADANLAAELGLAGVCFHVGYQKGHDTNQAALEAVARSLTNLLPRLAPGARVLLENGCEGSELGQTVAELGIVVRAVGAGPEQIGVVLDTCHLHVSGFDLASPDGVNRLADEVEAEGLTPYLTTLHLNDAREACGSHRDRHAIPGQGTIGEGMLRVVSHPLFAALPCILELSVSDAEAGIDYLTGTIS